VPDPPQVAQSTEFLAEITPYEVEAEAAARAMRIRAHPEEYMRLAREAEASDEETDED
jgi:hypothetical protein